MEKVRLWCFRAGYEFFPLQMEEALLRDAPVSRRYPAEMYYRLFAAAAHTGKTELANDVNRLRLGVEHTAVLHFCGKSKPWNSGYLYRFGMLYRHYQQLARRSWKPLPIDTNEEE